MFINAFNPKRAQVSFHRNEAGGIRKKSPETALTLILFQTEKSTKWFLTYVYSLWEGRPSLTDGFSLYSQGTQYT